MEFALNQRTAPSRAFSAFLDLAAEFGCGGIEPRANLGHRVFDGIAPARKRDGSPSDFVVHARNLGPMPAIRAG